MKKGFALVLVLILTASVAVAEFDLSAMSFDELQALQNAINAELVTRPEWKEVTVPGGDWIVGFDIPAGMYCVKPTKDGAYFRVFNESGSIIVSQGVRDEGSTIGRVVLVDGYTVSVERGSVILCPAITLGF